MVGKVKALVFGSNTALQRTVAPKLGMSVSTVHTINNKDLQLEKRHKRWVHKLLPRHISERRTNARKLYEGYLAGDRWKNVVALDEAYVYLSDCNKPRAIYYRTRQKKNIK